MRHKTILVSCEYFIVEKWLVKGFCNLSSLSVFLLICIIKGKGELIYEDGAIILTIGSNVMVPANMGNYQIKGNIEAIVCYVNKY